jgi:hypothetical protein
MSIKCESRQRPCARPRGGSVVPLQRTVNGSASSLAPAQPADRLPLFLQPKLAISQPGDPYEQEADRVAEKVMRMPEATVQRQCAACAAGGLPCPACAREEPETVSRKAQDGAVGDTPASVHSVLRSPGQPLGASARAFFEPRFGQDLRDVRVHTDGEAQQSARDVNALAYTVGSHVVFGAGRYAPGTPDGQHLLAHELTHVAQQTGGALTEPQRADAASADEGPPCPARREGAMPRSVAFTHAPAAILQRACATPSHESKKMHACLQPVVIADDDGSHPTSAPSFEQVRAIWGKCCVDYLVNASTRVNKTAYKTLEESPTDTPSTEESELFRDAGTSMCIQVFVPQTFSQGSDTGKHISGGGGTYDGATAHPKIVVVEGAASEVVAHEVGHATGYLDHDTNNTVMKPTGAHDRPNSTAVSRDVCTKGRTGSVLVQGAPEDCCLTFS